MATTYENVTPSLIPNTTMVKRLVDGVHKNYQITPNEGYVLHDNASDYYDIDPETGMESDVVVLTYYTGMCSCGKNYDFDNTTIIDGYTAYGSREFFARPATEVPENNIFGGVITEPEHEIM